MFVGRNGLYYLKVLYAKIKLLILGILLSDVVNGPTSRDLKNNNKKTKQNNKKKKNQYLKFHEQKQNKII